MALVLSLLALVFAPAAVAGEWMEDRICISYTVSPDPKFGTPDIFGLNEIELPQNVYPLVGEEFELPDILSSDVKIGIDTQTGEVYYGRWEFSGWIIPYNMVARLESVAVEQSGEPDGAPSFPLVETRRLCCSLQNGVISASWAFYPEYKLQVPEKLEPEGELPLAWDSSALNTYWPERVSELSEVYETGLFPESVISYMDENIRTLPLTSKDFASVPLSEEELSGFLNATKGCYDALVSATESSAEVRAELDALLYGEDYGHADLSTAFVIVCADRAGLLEGKSRALLRTADLSALCDFLRNDACADFLTGEELLSVYALTDGGELSYGDASVDFAREEEIYDTVSGKSSVSPGDLIVFKNSLGQPSSAGIVDSVVDRCIRYVLCGSGGTPAEYTLYEDELRELSRSGTGVEFITLRSCDIPRIIYEFLVNELSLPKASALGVMGNIYYESKFSPTAMGDFYTSFGLCQWHNERFLNLVIFCMENNYNIASLEGQLQFLAWELRNTFPGLLEKLVQEAGVGRSWARDSAYAFCRVFEQPAELDINAAVRGSLAQGAIWRSFSELFISPEELRNMSMTDTQTDTQTVTQQSSDYVFYTVRPGETLASICESLGIRYSEYRNEVNALNKLSDENMISVGQTLIFWRSMIKY